MRACVCAVCSIVLVVRFFSLKIKKETKIIIQRESEYARGGRRARKGEDEDDLNEHQNESKRCDMLMRERTSQEIEKENKRGLCVCVREREERERRPENEVEA